MQCIAKTKKRWAKREGNQEKSRNIARHHLIYLTAPPHQPLQLRDEQALDVGVVEEADAAELATEAAALPAAEVAALVRQLGLVDPDGASLEAPRDALRPRRIRRPHARA